MCRTVGETRRLENQLRSRGQGQGRSLDDGRQTTRLRRQYKRPVCIVYTIISRFIKTIYITSVNHHQTAKTKT